MKLSLRKTIQLILTVFVLTQVVFSIPALAGDDRPPQTAGNQSSLTSAVWHLRSLPDNRLTCAIYVNHGGGPSYSDVSSQCGSAIADAWLSTPPCVVALQEELVECRGYTLLEYKPGAPQYTTSSNIWNASLATSNLPVWLSVPAASRYLSSDVQLVLLAGHLISAEVVDAKDCPSGGLLQNGAANPCGMEVAHDKVIAWQNQFDAIIYQVALQNQVPPMVLKRLFMQESQFWPSSQGEYLGEYGLGHITEYGADTLLYWNQDYFNRLCKTVYSSATCNAGYFRLGAREQATLRGAVLREVRADCAECPHGIDLVKAAKSIPVFAQALVANAYQIEQVLYSQTGSSARSLSNYDDLWRFTLANYNGGVGCFRDAVRGSLNQGNTLKWELIAPYFSSSCRNVLIYVDHITDTNLANSLPEISDPVEETGTIVMDQVWSEALPTEVVDLITSTPIPPDFSIIPPSGISPSERFTSTLVAEYTPGALVRPVSTELIGISTETPMPTTLGIGNSSTITPTPIEITPTPTFTSSPVLPPDYPTSTPTQHQYLIPTDTIVPYIEPGTFVPNQIVVKFHTITSIFRDLTFSDLDVRIIRQIGTQGIYLVEVETSQFSYVLQSLRRNIFVEFAEPNYESRVMEIPNDPLAFVQTNLLDIQIPEAWAITTGGENVHVAVVDTGIDISHPDLVNQIWQNPGETGLDQNGLDRRDNKIDDDGNGYIDDWHGWNFVSENANPQDDSGHGTLVAGVIGAEANNLVGVTGIAPKTKLISIKASDRDGIGNYFDLAKAIIYATDNGAKIINLSLGGDSDSRILRLSIDYAVQHGVIVVAAAGNHAGALIYPAAYPRVISVSTVNEANQRASSAGYGSQLDLLAPGIGIVSTQLGGDYTMFSGTSAASAHVAGIAALLVSDQSFASAQMIVTALQNSALDLGKPGWDAETGYGLVQAYDALTYYLGSSSVSSPTMTPTFARIVTQEFGVEGIFANTAIPTPTLPPIPQTAVPSGNDPHVAHDATTASCSGCHRSHTSSGKVLRGNWPEEQVCFACHQSGGYASNIQPSFYPIRINTTTAFYKHDITAQNGFHNAFEVTDSTVYGGPSRHVECEDCHEPHYATRAQGSAFATPEPNSAPLVKRVQAYVSGVDPVYSTTVITPTNYTVLNPQSSTGNFALREYQICLKCHSSYTTLPTYIPAGASGVNTIVENGLRKLTSTTSGQVPDYRDLSKSFSPNNASYHPVMAVGRNQKIYAASFVTGWSANSMVYCSDCHNNNSPTVANGGLGTHGSSNLHILAGSVNYITAVTGNTNITHDAGEICFKCHQFSVYVNGNTSNTWFRSGNGNLHGTHDFASCYTCHNSHGAGQEHLINFDTAMVTLTTGYTSESAWVWNSTTNTGTCYISCHGEPHGSQKTYTP